jgi:hypothetical protein
MTILCGEVVVIFSLPDEARVTRDGRRAELFFAGQAGRRGNANRPRVKTSPGEELTQSVFAGTTPYCTSPKRS